MRNRLIPSAECARVCEWISLRLDAQLSEFEEVLLEAHLERCTDCNAVAESITGVTEALRATRLEEPTFAFQLPHKRRVRAIGVRAVSAAAAVAVIGLSSFVSLHLSASRSSVASSVSRAVLGFKEQQMEGLDNAAGLTTIRSVRQGVAAAEQVTVDPQSSAPKNSRPATRTVSEGR